MIPGLDIRSLSRLARLKLSAFVALSAATGYTAAAGRFSLWLFLPAAACLLLAAGASALNQYQERDLDTRMSRTRERPIPSGSLSPRAALRLGLVLTGAGLCLLAVTGRITVVLLGVLAVALYNGVYTHLKRRTAFAAVPGALIGTLGPAIGWTAAGGAPASPGLLSIMLVFYLWQVPHFWLLNLRFPTDYARAGIPCPVTRLGPERLMRLVVVWTISAVLASLMLPFFGFLKSVELYALLCAASVFLSMTVIRMLRVQQRGEKGIRLGFAGINLYMLVAMLLLLADRGLRL